MSVDTVTAIDRWHTAWPAALAAWSRYTRLSDPRLCDSTVEAAREGLSGSFAMIRLADQKVVIDLQAAGALGLDEYAVEILAHEVGHHVLAPATATDHYRLLARIRRGLPTLERHSAMLANLYTDLLINDRLQRRAGLRMHEVYRALQAQRSNDAKATVWSVYLRIYEHLWKLDPGSLGGITGNARADADAWLGARLVRVYADDWLDGAGRFAALMLSYLVEDQDASTDLLERLHDTRDAAQGCEPSGLTDVDAGEGDVRHPGEDPRITGEDGNKPPRSLAASTGNSAGQRREPFEYGEILKAAGVKLTDHEIAIRYYRDAAQPYLVPFPSRPSPESHEPLVEGLEPWDIGDPLDEIDWLGSVIVSPRVIPGLTTVRRRYGQTEGHRHARIPVDLDLYVDSSGSMPNPQQRISYPALAGAVIVLSALRAGSRVQATLWSGARQWLSTAGFVRDEHAILEVLTGFFGGATAFPLHKLRDTFEARTRGDRPCHILHISDDGITTLFADDERGNSGWAIAARALAIGGAGGTMALNIPRDWRTHPWSQHWRSDLERAEREGWDLHALEQLEDLLAFARAFSRRHYHPASQAVSRSEMT